MDHTILPTVFHQKCDLIFRVFNFSNFECILDLYIVVIFVVSHVFDTAPRL